MTQRDKFLETALLEEGIKEPQANKYMREMFPEIDESAPWCAAFISWCALHAGVSPAVFPRHASCTLGRALWKEIGAWRESGFKPRAGDLVYFDWDKSGDCDHVGIVLSLDGGRLHTIEGNSENAVRKRSYSTLDSRIAGFAEPQFDERDNFPAVWAQDAHDWARESGIMQGDERGDFKLTAPITREEAITLIYRAKDVNK